MKSPEFSCFISIDFSLDLESSAYNTEALSWKPGQKLSACTCPSDDHPGPKMSDGSWKGRASPEIDVFEAQAGAGKNGGPKRMQGQLLLESEANSTSSLCHRAHSGSLLFLPFSIFLLDSISLSVSPSWPLQLGVHGQKHDRTCLRVSSRVCSTQQLQR